MKEYINIIDEIGWWITAMVVLGMMITGIVVTVMDIVGGTAISVAGNIVLLIVLCWILIVDIVLMGLKIKSYHIV